MYYHINVGLEHIHISQRFLWKCIIVLAVVVNINYCLSNFLEYILLSQQFFWTYINILVIFFKYILKSLTQYSAILSSAGLNHGTSIFFLNASYTRSRITLSLIKLKDPESGFFSLLRKFGRFAFTVFLLEIDYWPSHCRAESRNENIVVNFFR